MKAAASGLRPTWKSKSQYGQARAQNGTWT
jgi:hypothetical protein